MLKTKYDWEHYAEKSTKASKIFPKGSYLPQGKMLGGSSAINTMIYLRGNPGDYDSWEQMGNPSWGYKEVLQYFRKSEDNRSVHIMKKGKNKFHATGGPLKVDFFHSGESTQFVFKKAVTARDHEITSDLNGKKFLGFTNAQGTVANGTRQSSAKAFLGPIKDRKNLHVIKNAIATNLLFNSDHDKVVGVKFSVKGKKFSAKVTKEVILSAGAINSPQILMNSGIGPLKHLKKHKIQLKHNLPVGSNLQDHVYVPLFVKLPSEDVSFDIKTYMDHFFIYIRSRIGPLASVGMFDFVGFVNTRNDSSKYPDIQFMHSAYSKDSIEMESVVSALGYHEDIVKELVDINTKTDLVVVPVILLKPKSRGRVRLRSKDPLEKVKIVQNYLDIKDDLDTIVRGIQTYEELIETKPFQDEGGELVKFNLPECDKSEFRSTEYWECYSKYFSTTMYHPVGTVKMGPEEDKDAVVDPTLKVRGVRGLRVVDASIMPTIVSANTNAAAIMIGEKGADYIKTDWKFQQKHDEL